MGGFGGLSTPLSSQTTMKLILSLSISGTIHSGVYNGGLEHPPVLPDNHETNPITQ